MISKPSLLASGNNPPPRNSSPQRQAELGDGGEALAVDRAWAVFTEGFEVLFGAVAFVALEPVFGVFGSIGYHQAVAGDFGDDTGGSD